MATELDAFLFHEPIGNQDIVSSWLDQEYVFTPTLSQQDLQDLEHHLFNFESDPGSSLPIPESPFLLDPYNFPKPPESEQNVAYDYDQPMLHVEQYIEPDVCDTFLNDSEFGLISPNDLSPEINIENYYNATTTPVNDTTEADQSPPMETVTNSNDSNKSDDDENEEGTEEYTKPSTLNCKNLVSERNRRKRLSQQLLSLRALVPNITKMDKRSVLVDALSYLRNIHEETETLQKELKEQQKRPKLSDLRESTQDNPSGAQRIPRSAVASVPVTITKPRAQITEIDTEKIEEKRFVVKITCKGGAGVGSDVLRVFESLDFEITYTAIHQLQPQEVLVTIFVRVRKQGKMTEEKLKDCITSMAMETGLTFQNP